MWVRQQITYEQPLNERIRTLLRLEFLFLQAHHSLEGSSVWNSRATLACILDILSVCSRTDLKTEVLKELERHATSLALLDKSPNVDLTALGLILDQLDNLIDRFHAISGQPGQTLRQNEFLNSIKQRSGIAGGLCDFDLPAYHFWLQQPAEQRTNDLRQWLSIFETLRLSIELIMRLVRECAAPTQEVAIGGFSQKSLEADNPSCQLVRVFVPATSRYYAEISGGKQRFTVRFMEPVAGGRAVQAVEDVKFELTCCII